MNDPVNFIDPDGLGPLKTQCTEGGCTLWWMRPNPFTMMPGGGGYTRGGGKIKPCPPVPKRVNLPSWKKNDIDMDHIASGHMKGGSRVSSRKDLFPDTMSKSQIEKSVRQAYRNGKKIETQGDRVRVIGRDKGLSIEMWVNTKNRQIESAYPKF